MKARRLAAAVTVSGAAAAVAAGRCCAAGRSERCALDRGRAALRLVSRGGARYAASAPQLFTAAGEQRQQLREDLALQTAEDVAGTLGAMKGVMMKIGQMASYVDDGLSPAVRRTLSRLQDSVPPMSPELAAGVVQEELGAPPEQAFARWDPRADRRRLDRAGAPRDHPRRPRGRRQGPVPGYRRDHRGRSAQRRAAAPDAADHRARPRTSTRCSPSCATGSWRSWTTAAKPATSSSSRPTTTGIPTIHVPRDHR